MLRRELADRFSGSAFGWAWAVAAPLITLAIYTLTFTRAMPLPVASAQAGPFVYALSTFAGLVFFGLFAEAFCRAPMLLHEHAWFLKSSIFPGETLAWIAVLRALVYAGIGLGLLLVFEIGRNGILPPSILLMPLIIIPFSLFLLGMVWLLAALGAFSRDVSYLAMTFLPLLMLATPVFYRASDLPIGLKIAAAINPVGAAIEFARQVILDGTAPPWLAYCWFLVVCAATFQGGHAVFRRYKGIAIDVI